MGNVFIIFLMALIVGGIIVKLVRDRKRGRSCCGSGGSCDHCRCCKGGN
ncbi:MAG: FeoB-associated Cys-rich membrane protein [Lentihominibacter sp.]